MAREYTKIEGLADIIFAPKAAGETNRPIGEAYGLTEKQSQQLVMRKKRIIENGRAKRTKTCG